MQADKIVMIDYCFTKPCRKIKWGERLLLFFLLLLSLNEDEVCGGEKNSY